jgi:TPR repeat
VLDKARARAANGRGLALDDKGEVAAAEAEYRKAVELDPQYHDAWFNLGLVHKRRREWKECLHCNLRAAELAPVKEEPTWWNAGIAATALRDWDTARRAWRGYGISISDGEGPVSENLGWTPVRIGIPDATEVVWCQRVDPARASILSVPLPESGHRHGDIVLHDGAPNGQRELNGRFYSVFDELERWEASPVPTLVVSLTCPTKSDADSAGQIADAAHLTYEDWTANLNLLCKACSEGRVHAQHDHEGDGEWRAEHHFGFAGPRADVESVIEQWLMGGRGRDRNAIKEV